jgi:hypothetical protein
MSDRLGRAMIGYLKDYELTTEIIFPKDGTGFRGSELSGLLNRDIYQQTSHKFMEM